MAILYLQTRCADGWQTSETPITYHDDLAFSAAEKAQRYGTGWLSGAPAGERAFQVEPVV